MNDQILEALEIGLHYAICDQADIRSQYSKPNHPTGVDEDVRKIEAAIALLKWQMGKVE